MYEYQYANQSINILSISLFGAFASSMKRHLKSVQQFSIDILLEFECSKYRQSFLIVFMNNIILFIAINQNSITIFHLFCVLTEISIQHWSYYQVNKEILIHRCIVYSWHYFFYVHSDRGDTPDLRIHLSSSTGRRGGLRESTV